MPVKIRLLIRRDGLIRHVLEVVVARIIGAHVIEAEMEIFAFPAASLGRAVWPGKHAAGLAANGFRLSRDGFVAARARADAIEERRVQIHGCRDYVAGRR
jgi:hypothetical protein